MSAHTPKTPANNMIHVCETPWAAWRPQMGLLPCVCHGCFDSGHPSANQGKFAQRVQAKPDQSFRRVVAQAHVKRVTQAQLRYATCPSTCLEHHGKGLAIAVIRIMRMMLFCPDRVWQAQHNKCSLAYTASCNWDTLRWKKPQLPSCDTPAAASNVGSRSLAQATKNP